MIDLEMIQAEQDEWAARNFGDQYDETSQILGVVEELGELCHAILKQRQRIRGSHAEHESAAKDAVGDISIFLMGLCNKRGWDLEEIIAGTWMIVRERDWTGKRADRNGDGT